MKNENPTIFFLINSAAEERLLSGNPLLKKFADIHFIYSFRIDNPVFTENYKFFPGIEVPEEAAGFIENHPKPFIILKPEEVIHYDAFAFINGKNLIETIMDKEDRQNNLIHFEKRIGGLITEEQMQELSLISIYNYFYFFPELLHLKKEKANNDYRGENKSLESALFLAENNYQKINSSYFKTFLEDDPERDQEYEDKLILGLYIQLVKSLSREGNKDEAFEVLFKAIEKFENAPSLNYLMAQLYFDNFYYFSTEPYLKNCLRMGMDNSFYEKYPFKKGILGYMSYYSLGINCVNRNDFTKAITWFEKSLAANEKFLPAKQSIDFLKEKLAKNQKKITLSTCMIVKNEASFISKAIESIKSISDEIIIFDTGSRDETKKIIRKLMDSSSNSNLRLYETGWNNDFSEIRNKSLSYAHGDWILYLDGDEELDRSSAKKLLQEINDPSKLAFLLPVKNFYESENTVYSRIFYNYRLFRNFEEIRFSGALYERIDQPLAKLSEENGLEIAETDILINHYGYTNEGNKKDLLNSFSRMEKSLIQKELLDNRDLPEKKIIFLVRYGAFYLKDNNIEIAQGHLEEAYFISKGLTKELKLELPEIILLYLFLSDIYQRLGNKNKAIEFLKEGISNFPENLSLLENLADLEFELDNFENALQHTKEIIRLVNEEKYYKLLPFNDTLLTWEAYYKASRILLKMNRYYDSGFFYNKALKNGLPESYREILKSNRKFHYK